MSAYVVSEKEGEGLEKEREIRIEGDNGRVHYT